jgi:hypothetical protein
VKWFGERIGRKFFNEVERMRHAAPYPRATHNTNTTTVDKNREIREIPKILTAVLHK